MPLIQCAKEWETVRANQLCRLLGYMERSKKMHGNPDTLLINTLSPHALCFCSVNTCARGISRTSIQEDRMVAVEEVITIRSGRIIECAFEDDQCTVYGWPDEFRMLNEASRYFRERKRRSFIKGTLVSGGKSALRNIYTLVISSTNNRFKFKFLLGIGTMSLSLQNALFLERLTFREQRTDDPGFDVHIRANDQTLLPVGTIPGISILDRFPIYTSDTRKSTVGTKLTCSMVQMEKKIQGEINAC
ncbi:hypothetical protein F5890DRAFT_995394 [Lentinula detonsa]|uniref:Uncharacterized protein n=1 Tax=Lentinula detonsa TaxID=2804962 RepID=A0AA38Q2J4_9AGAR|nr:hypothetical protein F5890DRAFT_995394 [Lentinula detonsa]